MYSLTKETPFVGYITAGGNVPTNELYQTIHKEEEALVGGKKVIVDKFYRKRWKVVDGEEVDVRLDEININEFNTSSRAGYVIAKVGTPVYYATADALNFSIRNGTASLTPAEVVEETPAEVVVANQKAEPKKAK